MSRLSLGRDGRKGIPGRGTALNSKSDSVGDWEALWLERRAPVAERNTAEGWIPQGSHTGPDIQLGFRVPAKPQSSVEPGQCPREGVPAVAGVSHSRWNHVQKLVQATLPCQTEQQASSSIHSFIPQHGPQASSVLALASQGRESRCESCPHGVQSPEGWRAGRDSHTNSRLTTDTRGVMKHTRSCESWGRDMALSGIRGAWAAQQPRGWGEGPVLDRVNSRCECGSTSPGPPSTSQGPSPAAFGESPGPAPDRE